MAIPGVLWCAVVARSMNECGITDHATGGQGRFLGALFLMVRRANADQGKLKEGQGSALDPLGP